MEDPDREHRCAGSGLHDSSQARPSSSPRPSWPDGIEVDPITQKVWWNTVMPPGAGDDPYKGAYWAVTDAGFR